MDRATVSVGEDDNESEPSRADSHGGRDGWAFAGRVLNGLGALALGVCALFWTIVGVAKLLAGGALMPGTPLEMLPPAARIVGGAEVVLGLAFSLDRIRLAVGVGAILLLIGFLGVAFAFPDADCGCFGPLPVEPAAKTGLLEVVLALHVAALLHVVLSGGPPRAEASRG